MKPVRSVSHSPNDGESLSSRLNQNTSYTMGVRDSRVTEKERKKKSAYLCGDGVSFAVESRRFRGLEIIKHYNRVTPRQRNLEDKKIACMQKKLRHSQSLLKITK